MNIFKKMLKPWFIYNPALVVMAFLFDIGMVRRGWVLINTCFGMPIYCDTRKAIGRAIYKNRVYELPTSELVWRMLRDCRDALFVDVGANIGYYSLLARKRLGADGVVMSFEPMPNIHEKLLINLRGWHVDAYPYAVSSRDGQATLSIPKGAESNDGISTLQECNELIDSFPVQTVSLDGIVDKEIYILKIDVEGHEYNVLAGAKSLLELGKVKNIIFEDHDIERSAVYTLLSSFGYKVFSIGWSMEKLILKPLGEPNSFYLLDAPNYIATRDVANLETSMRQIGWTVLRGI